MTIRVKRYGGSATETIVSNRIHPIAVKGKGWLQAGDLVEGDEVLAVIWAPWPGAMAGMPAITLARAPGGVTLPADPVAETSAEVVSVEIAQRELEAHNLTVANAHTYFIGETGLWVRNCPSPGGRGGGPNHRQRQEEITQAARERGLEFDREVGVSTPGGEKSNRFIDQVVTNPTTKEKMEFQIGEKNKRGDFVSRERRAQEDIEKRGQRGPITMVDRDRPFDASTLDGIAGEGRSGGARASSRRERTKPPEPNQQSRDDNTGSGGNGP